MNTHDTQEQRHPLADEQCRALLHSRGWCEVGGKLHGRFLWRSPTGEMMEEEKAFERLAVIDSDEGEAD